ncbi:MAG TPA: discoidin domain-containing protein [Spirochaetota bacterium]|nr:discoidin domain-containing protein [Spirochaetota bacterium]
MIYTDISCRKLFDGAIVDFSSEYDERTTVQNILKDAGHWSSKKHNAITPDFFVIDYSDDVPVNYIELTPSPNREAFPESFRIEVSSDALHWKIVHFERSFDIEMMQSFVLDMPITYLRYIRVLVLKPKKDGTKFFSEIGALKAGIGGLKELSATSSFSFEHDVQRILDGNNGTYWESGHVEKGSKDVLSIDVGNIFHINKVTLSSSSLAVNGFPEHFVIEVSSDRSIWTTVIEENRFTAESGKNYYWDIGATPARYVQITLFGVRFEDGKYGVRLGGLELAAAYANPFHTHNIGDITPYASVFNAGIVRLAKDGEDTFGTAVQGSDRRLRDASTIFKGIIQLANDGENRDGVAVQASDSRLCPASEVRPGIVRLAYDREDKPEAAVQGNDSRLKEATVTSYGITKLCSDGVYSENSVVTGNDTRLQKATPTSYGIMRLAADSESNSDCVVQGNDSRLRNATTLYKGIVELAENGEDKSGVVVQGDDKRLKDATTSSKGIVELAEDGEDAAGVAVQGSDRRLKDATTSSKGIVELAEDGETRHGVAVQGNDKRLKDATVSAKGIVELAEDGENLPGVAVQGNDKRLKDATELAKGIMRFAGDGEVAASAAVQSNDKRLRSATTSYPGIVEFAENGENAPYVAVQGDDRRLKDATVTSKGIVELAEDGEDAPDVAVQGNDRRLKEATDSRKGIMRFAMDAETASLAAVQGSDRRLKDATTTSKGIVELAEDGETRPGVAVQGNDKRLKDATVSAKGIVELAEDGEDAPGVAVQGNDRRLRYADEKSSGIMRFAGSGEIRSGKAVQADDPRLSDMREPLPHKHNYAESTHEFNSHTGALSITETRSESFGGIVPPPEKSAVIYAKNESLDPGTVGIAGITSFASEKHTHLYGVLGYSHFTGVRGQAPGNSEGDNRGAGVMGLSRFGAGGVFVSEHDYSLVVDGFGKISRYDDSIHMVGNGDALLVNGTSRFGGRIYLDSPDEKSGYPANLVELFAVDDEEYISVGDILVASDQGGGLLSRSRTSYNRSVIGIVSGNPMIIVNNSGKEEKLYPVVLAGKALCKIDARSKSVSPGDLIVASDTPGCGMVGDIDSFAKIGTVVAKALDTLKDEIGTIPVFVTHS